MQGWQSTYLGLREVPRQLSEFELQAFFTFSPDELAVIQRRRGPAMKLGLALHMGFVRMSGRPLDAFRVLPTVLLRHLGKELGIPVPDVASLRALYRRRSTRFEHQQLACRWLGFAAMTEHQRRVLLCVLKDEVLRSGDREQLLALARRWLYERRVLLFHDRPLRELVSAAVTELEAETTAALRETVTPTLWQRWLEAMSVARAESRVVPKASGPLPLPEVHIAAKVRSSPPPLGATLAHTGVAKRRGWASPGTSYPYRDQQRLLSSGMEAAGWSRGKEGAVSARVSQGSVPGISHEYVCHWPACLIDGDEAG